MAPLVHQGAMAHRYFVTVCRDCGLERDNDGVCPDCRSFKPKRVIQVVIADEVDRLVAAVERDRREPDKILCHVQTLRRLTS